MSSTVPSYQAPGGAASAYTLGAGDLMSAQTTQGQGNYQLGALESNAKDQQIPQMEDAAGANGRWFGGPRRVAEGNLDRSIKDQGFNIYSGMFDAMNQMTYNQGAAAIGYTTA